MSQSEKAAFFQALKSAGVTFDRHYREYTTDELKAAYEKLRETVDLPEHPAESTPAEPPAGISLPSAPPTPDEPPVDPQAGETLDDVLSAPEVSGPMPGGVGEAAPSSFFGLPETEPEPTRDIPVAPKDPNEMAGARQNTNRDNLEPIRIDPETGRVWYQEEVLKPAIPTPRGRRKLTYLDAGAREETIKVGDYTETFEVAGDPSQARSAEARITLPSYQVGIFRDPRFPFKVHCYNGAEAFDLFDVQEYYGGAELVPAGIKRAYVSNVLCYDIRTTVRAIESEYRQLQLQGKVS